MSNKPKSRLSTDEMWNLYKSGKSSNDIAAIDGHISWGGVVGRLTRAGYKLRPQGYGQIKLNENTNELIEEIKNGRVHYEELKDWLGWNDYKLARTIMWALRNEKLSLGSKNHDV